MPSAASNADRTVDLTRQEFLLRVLEHNESLQLRLLEAEINRRRHQAERGIFEPEFFATAEYMDSKRETTVEQLVSTQFTPILIERNAIYSGGLEGLVPTGARLRLGYTLRDISNNLQRRFAPIDAEYQTFFGASLVQPLLRNAGTAATMVNIRLSAIASEIAFQEYRRQLMVVLSTAEAAYWNLYLAQEQVRFFDESVELAETLVEDTRERVRAGRAAELDLMEAESGLALRRSRQAEARQGLFEAISRMTTLYGAHVAADGFIIRAVDEPALDPELPAFFERWRLAVDHNPDYVVHHRRIMMETVRVTHARNQRLPQLDIKASYGLNGLGTSFGESWRDVERFDFPTWTAGVEFRVPLTGGIRGRNELAATQLREHQAVVALKEVETQIVNALDLAIRRVRHTRDSLENYEAVIRFNEDLLETQLARVEVGRVESWRVLETEAALFEARISALENLLQHRRAWIEVDLISGATLIARGIDLSQEELERRTSSLLKGGGFSDAQYRQFLARMRTTYETRAFDMTPEEHRRALEALHEHERREPPAQGPPPADELPPVEDPFLDQPDKSEEDHTRALQALREYFKNQSSKEAPAAE